MNTSDYIFRQLSLLGVSDIFFLPGGGAMHLNDALVRSDINGICMLHEQSTGIAAEAFGRFSSAGFGCAVVTSGPGATNIITPVAGAYIESNPVLVISGQVKTDDLNGYHPNRPKLRQRGVQEVPTADIVKSITKSVYLLDDASNVRSKLTELLIEMLQGRPGPVWLDIPLDIQAKTLPDNYPDIDLERIASYRRSSVTESHPVDDVSDSFDSIESSARPVLLIGQGVRDRGVLKTLEQISEVLDLPVVVTFPALDRFSASHQNFIGRPGAVATRSANLVLQNADLIISLGSSLNNVITAYNPRNFGAAAKKIVVDIDRNELEKLEIENVKGICLDAHQYIRNWYARISSQKSVGKISGRGEWIKFCRELREKYECEYKSFDSYNRHDIMSHYKVVDILSETLPEGEIIITGSSGLSIEIFYAFYRNKRHQRVNITSGLGSMGFGLPAAIGAYFGAGKPERLWCIEGDGSFQMNIQELALLSGMKIPIIIVYFNNFGYSSIRTTQDNYFKSRYIGTNAASGLHIPNIGKVCEAYGIPSVTINSAEELHEVVSSCISAPISGPLLVECILNKDERLFPRVKSVVTSKGGMASLPIEDMFPHLPMKELEHALSFGKISDISLKIRESNPEDGKKV